MSFDWKLIEDTVEAFLGKGCLMVDPDQLGALIVKKGVCLVIIQRSKIDDLLIVNLRVSCTPNMSARIITSLSLSFRIELDQSFEFDHNGDMLFGHEATRYFVENAKLIMYGEIEPSKDSTVVRPKGPYTKHSFN